MDAGSLDEEIEKRGIFFAYALLLSKWKRPGLLEE